MRTLDKSSLIGLTTSIIGSEVEFLGEVASTNSVAKERAQDKCKEGLIVVASSQNRGRGRLDRSFISPEGGLYLSVVLRPEPSQTPVSLLPLLAGLAVSKSISTTVLKETSLKWPNDVLMEGKKVCGVLVESSFKGDKLDHVVIGIGINVNSSTDQLPEDIRERATTIKDITGNKVDMEILLRDLISFLDILYGRFKRGEMESILDQWSERSSTIGKQVRVNTGKETLEGKALGLDQSGALMISVEGSLQRVDIGDVEHIL